LSSENATAPASIKLINPLKKFDSMTDIVCCLSVGKGTWGHVSRLIQDGEWENIYIITNEFGKENFSSEKKFQTIVVDSNQPLNDLKENIKKELDGKISGDVAVNFVSGTGKEHMAVMAALLHLGVGIRLVALTKEGISEIS